MKKIVCLMFLCSVVFASDVGTNKGFVGDDNTVHKLRFNAEAPQICSQPYLFALAEGDISGHTIWSKIGFCPLLDTTERDIWSKGGTYVFPIVSTSMAVVSDNANDTLAGTGAQIAYIEYLDTNYNQYTTTIAFSGLAYSTFTPTNILRINNFWVHQSGTGRKAAGNLSLVDTATHAIVYGYITAGFTYSRSSIYTVPAGKTLYVVTGQMGYGYNSNSTHYARLYFRATQANGTRNTEGTFYPKIEVISSNNSVTAPDTTPDVYMEKTDIKCSGISTFTSGVVTVYFEGWIE